MDPLSKSNNDLGQAGSVGQPGGVNASNPNTPSDDQPFSTVQTPSSVPQTNAQSSTGQSVSFQAQNSNVKSKPGLKKMLLAVSLILIIISLVGVALIRFKPTQFFGNRGELEWWGLWEEESVMLPLIEEFQEQNQGVKIVYKKQSPQDYRERLQSSLEKGEGPDIFRFHNTWASMLTSQLDVMPSEIYTQEQFSEIFYPVIVSDMTSRQGLVGIPIGFDSIVLYINEDIFEASGKQAPKTWDDLRSLAQEMTILDEKGEMIQAGVALGSTSNIDHWEDILALMLMQNGVDLSNPTLQSNLARDAMNFFVVFEKTDKVWSSSLPPSTLMFANGKLAMYFAPSWRAFEIKEINSNLRFRTFTVPQLPKGSPDDPDIYYATYWAEGVWSRSNNKDIAWKFLKFLSEKESLSKLYANQSRVRLFGEAYPRIDMGEELKENIFLSSVIQQASSAKSWFLASRTFDGETGINTEIGKYYQDAINTLISKPREYEAAMNTLGNGISQVLGRYGVSSF